MRDELSGVQQQGGNLLLSSLGWERTKEWAIGVLRHVADTYI